MATFSLRRAALTFSGLVALVPLGFPAVAHAAGPTPLACAVSAPLTTTEGADASGGSALGCCVTSNNDSLTSSNVQVHFAGVPTITNGPGPLTSTVTRTVNGTASFSVTAGAESEVGAVLAKAKVSISASLTLTNSTSMSNAVTLTAGRGQYAHARYVSWGKKVTYRKYRMNYNCTTTTLATGTINFPTTSEGWYTWVNNTPYV